MSLISLLRAGYSFKSTSPLEGLNNCKVPILFIHGDSDNFVPFSMLNELYEHAGSTKQKLIIEGASHGACLGKNPKIYLETIEKFLDEYVKKADSLRVSF